MVDAKVLLSAVLLVAALSAVAFGDTYIPGPLPPEFGGGFIPPNRNVFKNIQTVQTGLLLGHFVVKTPRSEIFERVEKCYAKGALNFSRGKASGVGACINDPSKGVLPRYINLVNAAQNKGPGLPLCHDYALDGYILATLARAFNPLVYCQSPSGAFLDGVTAY
jgi:hypothetical protein